MKSVIFVSFKKHYQSLKTLKPCATDSSYSVTTQGRTERQPSPSASPRTENANTSIPDCGPVPVLEKTRRLFLFVYYCYGISFIDAAMLTRSNLENCNCGTYIVYKRNKTMETTFCP